MNNLIELKNAYEDAIEYIQVGLKEKRFLNPKGLELRRRKMAKECESLKRQLKEEKKQGVGR